MSNEQQHTPEARLECDCAKRLGGRVDGDVHLEGCKNFVPHGRQQLDAAVAQVVAMARAQFGEPEFRYFKKKVRWQPREKSHFYAIGDGDPITQEEYEANAAQAAVDEMDRFMGRLKRTYWRYERKQVAPAWRERLLELIPTYPA